MVGYFMCYYYLSIIIFVSIAHFVVFVFVNWWLGSKPSQRRCSTRELHMYTASTFGGDEENKDSTSGKEKRISKFVILDIVVIEQSIL